MKKSDPYPYSLFDDPELDRLSAEFVERAIQVGLAARVVCQKANGTPVTAARRSGEFTHHWFHPWGCGYVVGASTLPQWGTVKKTIPRTRPAARVERQYSNAPKWGREVGDMWGRKKDESESEQRLKLQITRYEISALQLDIALCNQRLKNLESRVAALLGGHQTPPPPPPKKS